MSDGPSGDSQDQIGERWPDKRARAVIFAGANKLAKEQEDLDPDAVADTGLRVRELLFTDAEVREDNANTKEHQIGYTADCMQFATLQPTGDGVALGLWVGPEAAEDAKRELGAQPDPNPFRSHFGWVRVSLRPEGEVEPVKGWILKAREHAAKNKQEQATL